MLDKLEAGKTYVFVDEKAKYTYSLLDRVNTEYISSFYKEGFTVNWVSALGGGYINAQGCVISREEMKYFKLKEENRMLKQDDKIQVEMTALEAVMVKNILGVIIGHVHYPLYKRLKCIEGVPQSEYFGDKDYTGDLSKGSKFYNWLHSQFKSPHQERIEQLEKEIHEKASELAKLKMEG